MRQPPIERFNWTFFRIQGSHQSCSFRSAFDIGFDLKIDTVLGPLDGVSFRAICGDERCDPTLIGPDADFVAAVADGIVFGLDIGSFELVRDRDTMLDFSAAHGDPFSHSFALIVEMKLAIEKHQTGIMYLMAVKILLA